MLTPSWFEVAVLLLTVVPFVLCVAVVLKLATLWHTQRLDTRIGVLIAAVVLLFPLVGPIIGWFMLRHYATPAPPRSIPQPVQTAAERTPNA